MNKSELDAIRALIAGNRIKEALERVTPLVIGTDRMTPLNIIQGQHADYQEKEIIGTMSFAEQRQRSAQITYSLLNLIQQLENEIGTKQATADSADNSNLDANKEPNAKTILLLAANPEETTRLRLDQEFRDIEEGLKRSNNRDRFTIIQKHAVRVEDLQRALMEANPHIVHFSGHGSAAGEIIVEAEDGSKQLLDPEAVGELFELFSDTVECVVLNACYTEKQADQIVRHIPYAVGMRSEIDDKKTALPFAVAFYDALGNGRDIEFAVKLAKNRIKLAGSKEGEIPVLKQKAKQ